MSFANHLHGYTPQSVDTVLNNLMHPEDTLLQHVRESCRNQGLPEIEVSAQQGKMLELLVRMNRSSYALEIGTLGGYSTICIAKGLIDGMVTTIEYEKKHYDVACEHFQESGYSSYIKPIHGSALEVLPTLEGSDFDFVFIDADKENNAAYLDWAVKLSKSGAMIVVDNVIRDGRVLDPHRPEKLEFIASLGNHEGIESSVVQTVGAKGWDGFVLARKL